MPEPKARPDGIDTRLVRQLASILNETGLSEIEVEREGLRIKVAKTPATVFAQAPAPVLQGPSPASAPAAGPAEPARIERAGDVVNSPMVGTVYLQPAPGAAPFAKPGDTVAAGQTLLLVEAMKTMNPIVAPRAGVLVEYLVADTQPVEYGEPLLVIG
jgi:acetyl-CoA carboxylase biotin carboxyl carrier protein